VIVTGAAHLDRVCEHLSDAGMNADVLIEPQGRDSAAAMAAAAAFVAASDPSAIMVVLSADHYVRDVAGFDATIEMAVRGARAGSIVTLGIAPTRPATEFGYIKSDSGAGDPRPVLSFVEKPDADRATRYVKEGYLWNSGMFVVSAATLIAELEAWAPEVLQAARLAVDGARRDGGLVRLSADFLSAPKTSIDFAVMERTKLAAVVTAQFDWADIGAWAAVWSASPRDEHGNANRDADVLVDARNVLIRGDAHTRVAVVGLSDVAVIAENGAVLVCTLDRGQAVKQVAERMAAAPSQPFIDLDAGLGWFDRWIRTNALPLWWTLGADHEHGGFHESLSLEGAPMGGPSRARVQARQAYVYAVAGLKGWQGPWRDAARHALARLSGCFLRADGFYRPWADSNGGDDALEPHVYDQAFVLLALATATEAGVEGQDWPALARALRLALETRRGPGGGYRETGDRPYQANANMHMFEAALAWTVVDPGVWGPLADELGAHAMARFFDDDLGVLREVYDQSWAPAPGPLGRLIEPGHQFEWAWLLRRWAHLRGSDKAERAAIRLAAAGARGVDAARGVALNELNDDFSIVDSSARLWPQTERLRTSLAFRDDQGALSAMSALRRYLDTPVTGLWRDKLRPDGSFVREPAPASSLYHLVSAWRQIEP